MVPGNIYIYIILIQFTVEVVVGLPLDGSVIDGELITLTATLTFGANTEVDTQDFTARSTTDTSEVCFRIIYYDVIHYGNNYIGHRMIHIIYMIIIHYGI